jgi:mRNA-degrading endonuclease RelE of RelBE toxin-antitoxin system
MIYSVEYSKEADKTLRKWKKSNPRLFKKASKILLDIKAEEHYNDK